MYIWYAVGVCTCRGVPVYVVTTKCRWSHTCTSMDMPLHMYLHAHMAQQHTVCHRTPLKSSLISNSVNLSMDLFLVFVAGMGIAGAGWATTLSQCAAAGFLASRLLGRGLLRMTDLQQKPQLARLMPLIKVVGG